MSLQSSSAFELTPVAIAALIGIIVLSIVPLYVLGGPVNTFFLGIPDWGWILFVIHFIILGLVVLVFRSTNFIAWVTGEEVR